MNTPDHGPIGISLELSREDVVDFLDRLAHDPGFRAEFEGDPRAVLAGLGVVITPEEAIPETCVAPPPEDLEQAIAALQEAMFWWPFIWVAFPIPFIWWQIRLQEGGGYPA